jgi:mannose-6-phosphate isomerase-like protein (cupin superfamily)
MNKNRLQKDLQRLRQLAGLREAREEGEEFFYGDIETLTHDNDLYRKVIFTGPHLQLVLMSIPEGEEIGTETHEHGDQFIRIEEGEGEFVIGGRTFLAEDGDSVVIPQGVEHNVINRGAGPLRLYAVYSPPEHPPNTEQESK